MYVYSWFIVLRESLLTVRLAVSEIKPVQSLTDRQTDRLTDRQTDRNVNYSNSRCACARGLIIYTYIYPSREPSAQSINHEPRAKALGNYGLDVEPNKWEMILSKLSLHVDHK